MSHLHLIECDWENCSERGRLGSKSLITITIDGEEYHICRYHADQPLSKILLAIARYRAHRADLEKENEE